MNSARKVRICAGKSAQPHSERDAMLLAIGRAASRAAERGIPFVRKIQLCAGDPDNTGIECMAKALADAEVAMAELRAATKPGMANRPRAAATLAAGSAARVPPTVSALRRRYPAQRPSQRQHAGIGSVTTSSFSTAGSGAKAEIVSSGQAGVTVQDRGGNHHQVRHGHVLPPRPSRRLLALPRSSTGAVGTRRRPWRFMISATSSPATSEASASDRTRR